MNYINEDTIYELEGENIFLSSSYSPKKILSLGNDNNILFDYNLNLESQKWNFIRVEDDKLLLKNATGKYICHFPEDNGNISLVDEFEDKYCAWNIGKNSEIYQKNNNGEEKYLWVVNNNLHIISDSYLADRWFIENDGTSKRSIPSGGTGTSTSTNSTISTTTTIFFILSIVLIVVLLVHTKYC